MYTLKYTVKSLDVNMFREMRLSAIFRALQEASDLHTELLGAGTDVILDRGLVWVVMLQRASFKRLPVCGEELEVKTWLGKTTHGLFPRYYRIEDAEDALIIEASVIWALMDIADRKMIIPSKRGIMLEWEETGFEPPLPKRPGRRDYSAEYEFTVPYSYIDLNGHMNNTRYFELAEDLSGLPASGKKLKELVIEYSAEAKLGEKLMVSMAIEDDTVYVEGGTDKKIFRLEMRY